MTKIILVEGEAIGKPRPRAALVGGRARVYTPSKAKEFEYKVAEEYRSRYRGIPPSTKPMEVEIVAYFGLNKGDYNSKGEPNKNGNAKLNGELLHTKKPDADNLAKAILDGLNGVAWVDDTQVVKLTVAKTYSLNAYTKVSITEIE